MISTRIFYRILLLLWLGQLGLRQRVTLTLRERILPCLSLFTVQRLILQGWVLVRQFLQ